MGARAGSLGSVAVAAVLLLGLAFAAPAASASTGGIIAPQSPEPKASDGWQAGTCTSDTPTCSIETPKQFFEQAAGHPPVGFTQFIVKHEPPGETPVGEVKTVRVDLPVGLSVNPGAAEQCEQATFEASPSSCPLGSAVGESFVTASIGGTPVPPLAATVYNIVPAAGEPARFGFNLVGNNIYLRADVAWSSDYHEGFTIDVPENVLAGKLPGLILKNRLVFNGRSGDGTFITTPSTCLGPAVAPFEHPYSTLLLAGSVEEEKSPGYHFPESARPPFESKIPPGTFPKECQSIPFAPSIAVDPHTAQTDSPAGATVQVNLPHITEGGGKNQDSSNLRTGRVTLPPGMGLNPAAANGLTACTDAQFGKGTTYPVSCPASSKVGTVTVETPPISGQLGGGPLTGTAYLGQQLSRDPTSGNEYRVFVDIESARYGISARLVGNISADPQTGQLTGTFAENPQVPFTSFKMTFEGGAKASLATPPTCGPHTTTSEMTPWSTALGSIPAGKEGGPTTSPPVTPKAAFVLSGAPGGGGCAKALGERPFAPSFDAKPTTTKAAAYDQLTIGAERPDGNQELKGAELIMPPGLSAKLVGVSYCPEAAIAAAAANSGLAERAAPSCPSSSLVGEAAIAAGAGPAPLHIEGKAFLAGPYHGAPLSLAVVTPAAAGPFDLGTDVVRVALFVDPETARVRAVSDPIPHVYGGTLLHIRSISVQVDRKEFLLNPTNCAPLAFGGTLRGGGSDPTNPAAFSSHPVSAPFQASGCSALGFAPKLYLRAFGATRRAQHPRLRAVLIARKGDANISRAAVTLPHSFFLDQSSLAKVCTRVQFAAGACPPESVYGYAQAFTRLLEKPLEGPVYLRSSSNPLPDLVVALHGQVGVNLVGRVDTFRGGIRTTYETVPDVPVSVFVLTVPGGRHGLLVDSINLCRRPIHAVARFTAQNGAQSNQRPKLRTPCRKKRHKRHRRR